MPPVVLFHEQTGQSGACLQGLGRYALRIARSPLTGRFNSAAEVRDWLWAQPIKLDTGDGEHEAGCIPAQRSRAPAARRPSGYSASAGAAGRGTGSPESARPPACRSSAPTACAACMPRSR